VSRTLELQFASFAPSTLTVQVGNRTESVELPAGVLRYSLAPFQAPQKVTLKYDGDAARLLWVDLRSGLAAGVIPGLRNDQGLMLADVASSRGNGTLETRLRVVTPFGPDQYTATVDVYIEPWGTHPDGHFGSWSVVVPADGEPHEYLFHLDPVAKTVSTTRDGQPVETFAWIGHPKQGEFRTSLTTTKKDGGEVANVPLYHFTVKGSRIADWQVDAAPLVIVRP
jgi:hypothetical protein